MSVPKSVVIGLDGATFDLLEPLIAEGVMPNLGRLLARGTRGLLASTIPPTTAPAWTTFSTGVNPGRHGIFDFRIRSGGQLRWVDSYSVRAPHIWDYAAIEGGTTGVINLPPLYPPVPLSGYMITGFMTPSGSRQYTYPPDLASDLEREIGQYIIYEPVPPGNLCTLEQIRAYVGKLRYALSQRAKALYWLLSSHPTDLLIAVFQETDTLQHLFWKYLDLREPLANSPLGRQVRPLLLECYQQIDDILGNILGLLGDQAYLVLVSDHGFGPFRYRFLVNEWLAQLGLLEYSRIGVMLEKVVRRVRNAVHVGHLVNVPLLDFTTRFVPDHKSAIRWARTRAFSGEVHQQAIYINVRGREPKGTVRPDDEYEAVRDQIITCATALYDPINDCQIHCRIYRREEIYTGPFVDEAPDLAIVLDDYNYQAVSTFSSDGTYVINVLSPRGSHRRNGILVIDGPGVRADNIVSGASIVDIAPTVLYLTGLGIPTGLDGRVLLEAFEAGWVDKHPPRALSAQPHLSANQGNAYTEAEAEDITARLRGLGYLE